jgi:hypothetical protein
MSLSFAVVACVFSPSGAVCPCRLGPVGAVFERFGAVKAGPFTAARLLREREAVLLFPGGGREVRPTLYHCS